jgi:hypothetical protein
MTTITIPKTVTKGEELVVIPRKDYEEFLRLKKEKISKSGKLDKDLQEAMQQVLDGKVSKPFSSVKELWRSLNE